MKKYVAMYASVFIAILSVIFATTDSAAFINKPQAPKELLKK